MITYPVDVVNTRWAVYRVSTSEIVSRNKIWPVADGSAIPGLDPDFVYLLQTADAQPQYDSRLFRLISTETVDVPGNTLHTSHTTEARPADDRKVAAKNAEAEQFLNHFPVERVALETALALGIVIAFAVDGQTVPARFRTVLDQYKTRVQNKILPNYDRLVEIIGQIDAGEDPDLDTGWTAPDAT